MDPKRCKKGGSAAPNFKICHQLTWITDWSTGSIQPQWLLGPEFLLPKAMQS